MCSLRVIVVDDDPDTCSFLRAVFEAEGHQCDAFLCSSDAELHFRNNRADLALVDVYLGTRNGVDLVQRLRELLGSLKVSSYQLPAAEVDLRVEHMLFGVIADRAAGYFCRAALWRDDRSSNML